MKSTCIATILIAAGMAACDCLAAEISSNTSPVVATVLGKAITTADVGLACDANGRPVIPATTPATCLQRNPLDELRRKIGAEIFQDYVAQNNLKATDEEIREFLEFQNRFMAQDRIRRQKDLAVLEKKLQDPTLGAKERSQAVSYRSTLLSLAAHDKEQDQVPEQEKVDSLRGVARPWIEGWKFSQSIYEKYGGTVGITKFGPDPVGATQRLFDDYAKAGKLVIPNENLRSALWKRLSLPPRFTAKPGEVDFTPYWKKPLPPAKQ